MNETTLDLAALRKQLRSYDKTVPRCKIENWRTITDLSNWAGSGGSFRQREICVLPEGHEGACAFSRPALGWPGFEAIQELIRLAEIATTATKRD